MDTTFDVPFTIGQVLWMPTHLPEKVTVPCPVCAGQLAVTVILGSGEHVGVLCEACGKGFTGPLGTIEELVYEPKAVRFEIARVWSMHEGRWWVESATGGYADFADLRATEAEALAESERRCAAQLESNMQMRQRHRGNTKQHTWSIQYHRKQIADLERQIAWHRSKVEAKPAPEAKP
jgi:hypothetical protein